MADQPEKKKEVGIRGDVGIRWVKGEGQFEEPVPPVKPTELDGTKLPVHMYLDPGLIGPNPALDPKSNDDNNQEKIDRGKKHPIKWYVKVPGGGDQHHDDYSYHGYPWDGHSGSSSMSPPYSSSPTEDTSGGGYPIPPDTGLDPANTTDGSGILFEASPTTNTPTQQVQFGGAPPNSPALSQRFNIFPFRQLMIPAAFRTFRKFKGEPNLSVTLILKPGLVLPGGESIEMNVTLIPLENMDPPSNVWRKAFLIDDTWPGGADGEWTKIVIPFLGFDASQEYPVTFNICRRSDVSPNYNCEVFVMSTVLGPWDGQSSGIYR